MATAIELAEATTLLPSNDVEASPAAIRPVIDDEDEDDTRSFNSALEEPAPASPATRSSVVEDEDEIREAPEDVEVEVVQPGPPAVAEHVGFGTRFRHCLHDFENAAHNVYEDVDFSAMAHHAVESAEDFLRRVWEGTWRVVHFQSLPAWLQDNDFLHHAHRPPLPSFSACFKSIFRYVQRIDPFFDRDDHLSRK